jgi:hypothetical protein
MRTRTFHERELRMRIDNNTRRVENNSLFIVNRYNSKDKFDRDV